MFINPAGKISAQSVKQIDPQEVIYDFLNPRIVSFALDDLTHESSDPSLLTVQFDYDWIELAKVEELRETNSPRYNISVPEIIGAPVDILSGLMPVVEPTIAKDVAGKSPAGAGNPFIDILSNQAGRAVQRITGNAVNRAVSQIAGRGRFGGFVAGALTPIARSVGGVISTRSRELINRGAVMARDAVRSATRPVAVDTATPGGGNATGVRSTDKR